MRIISAIYLLLGLTWLHSCISEKVVDRVYQTKNVVVVVIDGPRYSESWGQAGRPNVPYMDSVLAPVGCTHSNFYNLGETWTTNGHVALTTGVYQSINNTGGEYPKNPGIFQHYLKKHPHEESLVWLIASKDKLQVLSDCKELKWRNKYIASTDCGINGLATGYRHDSITFQRVKYALEVRKPKVLFVNFREPDFSGHKGDWNGYIQGIQQTDSMVHAIWKHLQSDPYYQGKTTMFVTNDHGRHLDGVSNGYVSHGCTCEGCRRIHLWSFGPDFKQGVLLNQAAELIDVNATIGELLQLHSLKSNGRVLWELFQ
jgi:bisphosphoglycerate-independent phosphoglycerate mutase (AlkP superfamily)